MTQIANIFAHGNVSLGLEEFEAFEKAHSNRADAVYGTTWRLIGSPVGRHWVHGKFAFLNAHDFYTNGLEKAEAIYLTESDPIQRIEKIIRQLEAKDYTALESLFLLRSAYPKINEILGPQIDKPLEIINKTADKNLSRQKKLPIYWLHRKMALQSRSKRSLSIRSSMEHVVKRLARR